MAFELPRLPSALPDDYEQFRLWWTSVFAPYWQTVVETIEAQEAAQDDLLTQILAAQATADAAQTTANTANTTASTVKRDDAISSSWVSPGSVLSAADVGADATITIAAHTRKYGDNTSVAVNGGTITGRAFSTVYHVYYDQTSRAGGAVSYQATTNANTAAYNAAAGRHFVGTVTTPADGGAASSGGTYPPGFDPNFNNIP
jgi:hypothetical protein